MGEFDFGKYQDEYAHNVRNLIESRAAGKKVVAGRGGEAPAIINLMDLLTQGLAGAQSDGPGRRHRAKRRAAKAHRARPHHIPPGRARPAGRTRAP